MTYQTTRGSGQPVTVQCSRTHCFSHTVCERGLITNSGECIRLSSFMRLKCSSCSWICKVRTPHSRRIIQAFKRGKESLYFSQGFVVHEAKAHCCYEPECVLFIRISQGVKAFLFVLPLSQCFMATPLRYCFPVSQATQSPEEFVT